MKEFYVSHKKSNKKKEREKKSKERGTAKDINIFF